MIIRSQVREEETLFGEGSRQGAVFSLCRDSLSLITLAHALMTVVIETSRCAQLKFMSQSFQPCQWSMALEVRELLFIPEGRSWHLAKSWVSSICGSPEALFHSRDGGQKKMNTKLKKNKTKIKHHHPRPIDSLQKMIFPKKAKGLQVFTPCSGPSKTFLSLIFLGSVSTALGMSSSMLGSSDSAFFQGIQKPHRIPLTHEGGFYFTTW